MKKEKSDSINIEISAEGDGCCIKLYTKVVEVLGEYFGDRVVNQESNDEFIKLLSKVENFYKQLPENKKVRYVPCCDGCFHRSEDPPCKGCGNETPCQPAKDEIGGRKNWS